MELLEKYCQKKWISILGIVGGAIPLVIALFLGMFKVFSFGSLYALLYYVGLIVFIMDLVISIYAIVKKSKSLHMIVHVVLVAIAFIMVLQYRALINALAGNISGLLYYVAANYNSFMSEETKLVLTGIVCVGLVVHSILVYIKIVPLGMQDNARDMDTEKLRQEASELTDKTVNNVKTWSHKGKEFLGTKKGKTTMGIAGIVFVLLIGVWGYFTFFNKTKIDLVSNMTVEFTGNDGEGEIVVSNNEIDYDKTNSKMATFIYGLSYSYKPDSGELSNGDKVMVTVEYSKETANSLKLDVTKASKEFTVKGLTKIYSKASEIDKKLASTLKKDAQSSFDEEMENVRLENVKTDYVASYFTKAKKASSYGNDNCYVAVYKVTGNEKSFWSDEVKEVVYYYATYTTGVDSSYDSDDGYWYNRKLTDDSYQYISDASQIESSLGEVFPKTNITKFE